MTFYYCSRGESVSFANFNSLLLEGKQKHIYCVNQDIADIRIETASYKILPLGSNV
jgi:hypothetical protein